MAARRGEQASLHLPIASRAMPIPGRADLPIASRDSLHLSGKNKSIIGLNRKIADKKYWLSSNIVPIKSDEGDVTGYIAVETDITERRNQLALIAEKEKNLSTLLDTSSEMVQMLKMMLNYITDTFKYRKIHNVITTLNNTYIFLAFPSMS